MEEPHTECSGSLTHGFVNDHVLGANDHRSPGRYGLPMDRSWDNEANTHHCHEEDEESSMLSDHSVTE